MADNDYLGNIQSQRLNQQWSNSMAWSTPSWMQGGFKQGTPQGGGSTFRAANAGVQQSWTGDKIRDTRTRPTNWQGALDLYKESIKEGEEDDGSSSSGPATTPASRPKRTPAGTRTPAGGGTTPTGTTTPTSTPAGRPRPRWMPRFSPAQPEAPAEPAPIVKTPFSDLAPAQQKVATAMQQQKESRTASTPSASPAQTPAFGPMQRSTPVMATNLPARTSASPSAPKPLTDKQQVAVAGVAEMKAQRQNPSAPSTPATGGAPSTPSFDSLRDSWNPTFATGSGNLPSSSALSGKSRAQNRSAQPSRIGNFGQNRIDTNLAPFK